MERADDTDGVTVPAKISWASSFAFVGYSFGKALLWIGVLAVIGQCTCAGCIW